jgi:predicted DNA-binding protein with PD1-like motif
MNARECSVRNEYLASLERGADWRDELEEFAAREDVGAAWFSGTGSVDDAEVWFYDRDELEYRSVTFDEPLEVAAAQGTVTLLDGDPFARTHAVLSRVSGQALAGYLDAATVFSGEVYLRTFEESISRTHDERTGLDRIP